MKFQTTRFGELSVEKSDMVHFSQGLLGFESLRKFVIINQGDDSPFKWLQSLEEAELAFIVIQPRLFRAEFEFDLSDRDAADLEFNKLSEAEAMEAVVVYAIVTVPNKVEKMTANLQGPIVINARNNRARQVIVTHPAYHTRHEILTELRERGGPIEKGKPVKKECRAGDKEGGKKC